MGNPAAAAGGRRHSRNRVVFDMTFLILAALAGAIANRIRGGLFPLPGDASGRIIWGIVCGIIVWQPGVPWWVPCDTRVDAIGNLKCRVCSK